MSEEAPKVERTEALHSPEHRELLKARAEKQSKTAEKKQAVLETSKVRNDVEQSLQAASGPNPIEKLQAAEAAAQPARPTHVNSELKGITLRRELQQIRRKLPAPQRALSRTIHQPVVRVISAAADKTVSRPSGLLGGGMVAFLGTSGYLYLAKQYGFTYNYLVFLVLFIGGFGLGLIIELFMNLALSRRVRD